LKQRLEDSVLILDGAMGTQLFAHGIESGRCNDYLNIEEPDIVKKVHQSYIQAGSQAIITNTFGANKFALARHNLADKLSRINEQGAKIARDAALENVYVLGDIGPCGDFIKPLGNIDPDELTESITAQASALAQGGVDGYIIETMTAIDEIETAVDAVKKVSSLPVFVSLAYDLAGSMPRTMMGVGAKDAVSKLCDKGITAIGYNCGTLDMHCYVDLTAEYVKAVNDYDVKVLAEPNAGKPELVGSQAVYSLGAKEFADSVADIAQAGAGIIGGCCGTSPEHIRVMAERLGPV
jgi:5-methyltetrahydrofolate--homocysteine methyltransferase